MGKIHKKSNILNKKKQVFFKTTVCPDQIQSDDQNKDRVDQIRQHPQIFTILYLFMCRHFIQQR